MLERLASDLRQGGRPGLVRASRLALTTSFLAMAVPGLLLGALLTLDRRSAMPVEARFGLLLLAVVLAAVSLQLAVRAVRNKAVPAQQAALTGAFQAGSAPGVVFLLGCTMLSSLPFTLLFWSFAGLLFWLVWRQYPGWVRGPEAKTAVASPVEAAQHRPSENGNLPPD